MQVTDWRKSSRSGQPEGHWCVEAGRITTGGVAVRDTKQLGEGPILSFTREEWAGFLGVVKGL